MKKAKSKLLSLFLAFVMVLGLMPTAAFAAEAPVCQNTRTGETYTNMAKARNAAKDGDTLKLLRDASSFALRDGKTLTLDLGGFNMGPITMNGSGFLTVKNGTVTGDVWIYTSAIDEAYNSFTLAADAKIDGNYGIVVSENRNSAAANNYGTTVNVDGEITGTSSALWVLGNIQTDLKNANNPVVVNVGPTAKMTNVNPNKDGSALQMAGACKVTVEDGAEITGPTAIEVRAGSLTVNGGKITATVAPTTSTSNGSGTSTHGAGIGISQHGTNLPISVTINDGEVTGYTALYVTNPEKNEVENNKVTATVNGGSFTATNDEKNPIAQDDNAVNMPITITSGTFSGDVTNYVVPDAAYVKDSASYVVGKEATALVENAKAGDTLTLLQYDSEITVPEGVTINNQTGDAITVNGNTVAAKQDVTTTHNIVETKAKAATCTEAGNIAYWYCTICNKYYSDEACTKEIAQEDTVTAPKGHGETELQNAKAATCAAEGYTGDKVCKICGEIAEAGKTTVKTTHIYKDGKCTVCGAADPSYKPATAPDKAVPQTGDNTNIALYLVLMLASGVGLTGTVVYSRKKKST